LCRSIKIPVKYSAFFEAITENVVVLLLGGKTGGRL
jgi:hypothetical protein